MNEDETDSDKPPQNVVLLSPTTKGYYFSLEVSSGKIDDIYPAFLGAGLLQSVLNSVSIITVPEPALLLESCTYLTR